MSPLLAGVHRQQQQHALDQRNLIMSSYPFLQYAVDNLLFHMLSPRFFRYFLPQHEILLALSANRARLWRRWTSLLGTADAAIILAKHSRSSATAGLLSPVFGARFRLERVFRKLENMAIAKMGPGAKEGGAVLSPITPIGPASPRTPRTPRTMAVAAAEERMFWQEKGGEAAVVVGGGEFRLPPIVKLPVPRKKGPVKSPLKSMIPVRTSMLPIRIPGGKEKGSPKSPARSPARSPGKGTSPKSPSRGPSKSPLASPLSPLSPVSPWEQDFGNGKLDFGFSLGFAV